MSKTKSSSAKTPPQPAPAFRLDGRVALVTGSSKGLGKAMAMALGAAGAKVVINYANSRAAAEATFREFTARATPASSRRPT